MLELKNVSYSVDNDGVRKDILKNVNLTVDEGFAVITGPNGSGKSTLAKIIAGIITPTSGQIFLDGVDITSMSITERANAGISFAFQRPVKFKGITVKDLSYACRRRQNKVASQALEYLTEVGLDAKQYIFREVNGSLSGGELKRIEIAMVLARGTKLSIFDEPEAGIDLWSFNSLIKVFAHLHDNVRRQYDNNFPPGENFGYCGQDYSSLRRRSQVRWHKRRGYAPYHKSGGKLIWL